MAATAPTRQGLATLGDAAVKGKQNKAASARAKSVGALHIKKIKKGELGWCEGWCARIQQGSKQSATYKRTATHRVYVLGYLMLTLCPRCAADASSFWAEYRTGTYTEDAP